MITVTHNDPATWLAAIWDVLHMAREDCISEGTASHDRQWDEVCTAMAWVQESLGLQDGSDEVCRNGKPWADCNCC